jgi:hypothetical protein
MALVISEVAMKSRTGCAFIAQLLVATSAAHGQVFVGSGHDPQLEALNAVLRFRGDLTGKSTVIAECRLSKVRTDSTKWKALDAHFRSLLVLPVPKDSGRFKDCDPIAFANMHKQVLWLDTIIVIAPNRVPSMTDRTAHFEITLQVFSDGGYREYQRYFVGTNGNYAWDAPDKKQPYYWRYAGWRVLEYNCVGADFDWGTNCGASSGYRRP